MQGTPASMVSDSRSRAAMTATDTPATAASKRRARAQKPAYTYKDVEVVVNAAADEQLAKEAALLAKFKKKEESPPDAWSGASWAAWSASNMMGDVLLKIDQMTRENEDSGVK